ncbi:MAG: ABC transporter permease [Acidimicrobiales bacterium]
MCHRHGLTWLVAQRELRERSRATSFRVATAILIVAVGAGVAIPALAKGHSQAQQVGVVSGRPSDSQLVQEAGNLAGVSVVVDQLPSLASAQAGLSSGSLAAVLVSSREVLIKQGLNAGSVSTTARLAGALSQLAGLQALDPHLSGGSGGAFAQQVALPIRSLKPPPHQAGTRFTGLYAAILIYVLILFYGIRIAVGVGEEKASRVVEVLLATLRPTQLLVGKVLGMGLLAVLQVIAMVVTVVVVGTAVGSGLLHGSSLGVIGIAALWFLIGYAFYCTAFAAVGSLINRQADSYNATFPLQIPLVLSYILSFSVVFGGANTFDRILGFLPPTAPVMMTALYSAGAVPLWQVGVSAVICLVATVGMARVAALIYERAILRTGARVRIREVLGLQSPTS